MDVSLPVGAALGLAPPTFDIGSRLALGVGVSGSQVLQGAVAGVATVNSNWFGANDFLLVLIPLVFAAFVWYLVRKETAHETIEQ